MALADLLSLPAPLPDYAAQANASIAQQQAQPHPSKLRNFLGALGDAFSVGSGGQPNYRNKMQAAQLASAVGQYLGDPSSVLAQIMQINPEAGIDLYKAIHPASEVPAALKEWDAYQKLPADQQAAFIKFRQALDPQIMSPITLGPNDTYVAPGGVTSGASGPPQSAVDYLKAHPDLAPQFDQKYGQGASAKVLGGATASPPRNFPVNNPGALRVPGSTQFQTFPTPQQGIQAQVSLLSGPKYIGGGNNTVRGIVETYAPRKSKGGDNTDAQVNNYISYVSNRLGVKPDQPVANVSQLARAMREFETGQRAD